MQRLQRYVTGTLKMRDMNLRDMKMPHHVAGVENARHEFSAPTCKGGNCETWKCGTMLQGWKIRDMNFRHQLARVEIARHENARNAIVWNTECCIRLSIAEEECMSRQEKAPDFCAFTSLTVMTWTIISWCWLSVTNVCLAFTQVVLSAVLSIVLHWLYRAYSLFNFIRRIFDILKTTTVRTLRLRLKIDFDTDLTPNITRHSCIISAELVVSSFINNLVRLSSIVPFHIIYQVNLYWRNNSAHKYNYFETLFHTLAFHTNFSTPATWCRIFMSRIFHPCKLVPQIHVSHFQVLHFWPSRIFMSRIFSRPDICLHWRGRK